MPFAIFAGFRRVRFCRYVARQRFYAFRRRFPALSEQVKANNQWWLSLNEANQIGSSEILTNNILVTFRVFAIGAFFGIGTVYDLAFEGARLGSVFAVCYKLNPTFGNALVTFVVGHGVIELSCIFICARRGNDDRLLDDQSGRFDPRRKP